MGPGATSLVESLVSSAPGPTSWASANSIRHKQMLGSLSICSDDGADPYPSGLGGGWDSASRLDTGMCLRIHHDGVCGDQEVGPVLPLGIEEEIRPQAHLDSLRGCELFDSIEHTV